MEIEIFAGALYLFGSGSSAAHFRRYPDPVHNGLDLPRLFHVYVHDHLRVVFVFVHVHRQRHDKKWTRGMTWT